MRLPVNLDYHSHFPLDPRVHQKLCDAYNDLDANPHSTSVAGDRAKRAVEESRASVAQLTGFKPIDVIFTSGATEANNLAITGLVPHATRTGKGRIIVSAGEHLSVLRAAEKHKDQLDIMVCPLLSCGTVDLVSLGELVTPRTALVSVAAANHEIGVVQPLRDIAEITRRAGALLHSDLAQAAGKVPVDTSGIDLVSVSAHKVYGPLGVGALLARRHVRKLLDPIVAGGGQEGGLRSGTVPAALCTAFGTACELASALMQEEARTVAGLRDRLWEALRNRLDVQVNGRLDAYRLPGNLSLAFDGVDGEALVMRLRERVTISTGSACTSASLEPSHVLQAIGLSRRQAESSIRIGIGRFTTAEQIDFAAAVIADAVLELSDVRRRLRA